jgi:molybdopterin synthase catalytic subunit
MAVRVQTEDFDIAREIEALAGGNHAIGAVASFIGKVRDLSGGEALSCMTLEHYPGMTEKELEQIEAEAGRRFALTASTVVHRVGPLSPGDNIVLVIAAAPHRANALDACAFVMDYLKTSAPFWKKETLASGAAHWIDARDTDTAARERWQQTKS